MTTAVSMDVGALLRRETLVSLGCTEPAALGWAASAASALVEGEIQQVDCVLDGGTFKNTLAVGLPGTTGKGPFLAAAAGALISDGTVGLRVFAGMNEARWAEAARIAGRVRVLPDPLRRGVSLAVTVVKTGGSGTVEISGRHDRIVSRAVNGVAVNRDDSEGCAPADAIEDAALAEILATPADILAMAEGASAEDLALMARGVAINRAIAETGLRTGAGNGYGSAIWDTSPGGLIDRVRAWVAAGIEARMAGVPLPVMTSGGSGNSGLTVFLGPALAAESLGIDDPDRVSRACVIASLFNIAVKCRVGRVGPLCGGTISSALGVGCAVADLMGAGPAGLDRLVRYMVLTVGGTLCDGAKPACSFKVSAALAAALDAARLEASGRLSVGTDGLAGAHAGDAMARLSELVRRAYAGTDGVITDLIASRDAMMPPKM